MLRTLSCACAALLVCGLIVVAAEKQFLISEVDTDKNTITGKEVKGKNDFGDKVTIKLGKDVKIVRGVFDPDTKSFKDGDPIEGGIKNEMFSKDKLGEKGKRVRITTEGEGDKETVTKISVVGKKQ